MTTPAACIRTSINRTADDRAGSDPTWGNPTAGDRPGRPSARRHRAVSRLIVVVLLTLVAGVGLAGPASAHNVLISSDPTEGSTLQTAPTIVRLTFDQPVQNFEPVVTVIGPDGQRYESGSPQVDSTVVTAGVGTLPVAGAYTIAYRIVSADGHPVQGEITFRLADRAVASGGSGAPAVGGSSSTAVSAPAASAAAVGSGPVTSTSTAAVAPAASSSGLSGWVWVAIAVAAILVAAAVFVIVRRPRQLE